MKDRPGFRIGVEVSDLPRRQLMLEDVIFDTGVGKRARGIDTHGLQLARDKLHRGNAAVTNARGKRSEEHTSELQSLMRTSYAVICLKKKKDRTTVNRTPIIYTYRPETTTLHHP